MKEWESLFCWDEGRERKASRGRQDVRMHEHRVCCLTEYLLRSTRLGQGLTEKQILMISIAAGLHDIGKHKVPHGILDKPGKLIPMEYERVKEHTWMGEELLLEDEDILDEELRALACDIARHHHERWDGGGYPDGLKGQEISRWARLVSIADVYDALVSVRPYRRGFSSATALRMMKDGECGAFDPEILEQFCQAAEGKDFPFGMSMLYDKAENIA